MSSMKHTTKGTGSVNKPTSKRRADFAAALREGISNYISRMIVYMDLIENRGHSVVGDLSWLHTVVSHVERLFLPYPNIVEKIW